MIKVFRGRARDAAAQEALEQELESLRGEQLPRIRDNRKQRALQASDFETCKSARAALDHDQYGKCCYCERYPDTGHLEHFRPKSKAVRKPGHPSGEGYYWLAWTWDNLLFACSRCNLQKNTLFPLAPGCKVLEPEEKPPGSEHPLLIDPGGSMDPFEHIQFRLVEEAGTDRWKAFPRHGSLHGYRTIKDLNLNGQGLLDRYERHVELYVSRSVEHIREAEGRALATRDAERLCKVWRRELAWLCNPKQELTALSCDVLDHHFPRMFQRRWELPEPRPAYARAQSRNGG